jgi:hypothetical protein
MDTNRSTLKASGGLTATSKSPTVAYRDGFPSLINKYDESPVHSTFSAASSQEMRIQGMDGSHYYRQGEGPT